MRGQTQAITAVLVTGIMLAGIGTAYFWGLPLLEKRQVEEEAIATEEDVFDLYNSIKSISDQGSGATDSVSINADTIRVNENKEFIQVTKELDQPVKQEFGWSLIEGDSFVNTSIFGETGNYGLLGEEKKGVIALKSTGGESSTEITYRVDFRNLCSENSKELSNIDLEVRDQERAAGSANVEIKNVGEDIDNRLIMERGSCEGIVDRKNQVIKIGFE